MKPLDAMYSSRPQPDSTMSLASLMNRELSYSKLEKPILEFGQAGQSKKGEDFYLIKTDCERFPGDSSSHFGVFAIFDGHNGRAAAIYSKDNVLKDVLSAIPQGLSRKEWLEALPRAMVAGFVKTDKEFQTQEQSSGTTATFVIIDGWTITVASVGDSRCILESDGGAITILTADHRLEVNDEERARIKASGGEVGRLCTVGGAEIGPLRCWPGGLCLSRSIGDMDVGEFIVPIPYVKQINLSSATGARLIVASDGVWDALSPEKASRCCRGLDAPLAAKQVVKEALRVRGLRDDTTCLVVDIAPPLIFTTPAPQPRKQSKNLIKKFFKRPDSDMSSQLVNHAPQAENVQEVFEEGSALLADRLGTESAVIAGCEHSVICAICQRNILRSEGISVHAGSLPGPLLCVTCKQKQEAMEGKLPSKGVWVG